MSFFYDLNKKLNGIGAEQKKLVESKQAPKTPARQTLEQALRSDLKSLMEDGTGGANFSGSGSLEEKKEKWIQKATKPSTKGDLHKALKVPQGEKIPKAKINKATHSKDEHLRHMAQFAKNVANEDGGSEMECDNPTPSKGIPGNIPVPGKMDRLKGKRDYYEADHSEEDIMDYLNRKLAPHDKQQQAKEDAISKPYNGSPNKADAYNGMEFEGNAFTGKLKSTPKGGKFKLGGKEYTDTSELDEAVSRKHFQAIADTLKHIEDMDKRKELAHHHASAFKLANPRFDQKRFFQAAGITDEGAIGGAIGAVGGGLVGGPVGAAIGGGIGGAMEEGFDDMYKWLANREKEKGTGKFDKRKVSTGTVYTRKFDDEPEDDTDAPVSKGCAPRGRGRPAGTKRATGAKHSGRSKLASKDAIAEEGCQVCSECGQMIAEKSKSQAQAHMMAGVAHNPKFAKKVGIKQSVGKEFNQADKGKDISKLPKKVKKTEEGKGDGNLANNAKPYDKVTRGDVIAGRLGKDEEGGKKKFKKEEKVDETTTSGSVATTAAPKAKSNSMGIGKGIYDSINREVEKLISESVDVQMSRHDIDGAEADGDLVIRASGAEADAIKDLLKNAGIINYDNDLRAQEGDMEEGMLGTAAGAAIGGAMGGLPGAALGGVAGHYLTKDDDDEQQTEEGAIGSTVGGVAGAIAGAEAGPEGMMIGHEIGSTLGDKLTGEDEEVTEADAPVTQNSPDYPSNQEESDDALQYSGGLNGPKSTGQTTIPVLASQEERQMSESDSFLNLYKAFAKIK